MGTRAPRRWSGKDPRPSAGVTSLVLAAALLVAAGCGMRTSGEGSSGNVNASASGGLSSPAPDGQAQPRTVADILSDPLEHVGSRVRVLARVHFLSECPPPASGQTATCVLVGWLTEPDRSTFIASDVGQAVALADHGNRVSCEERNTSGRGCGDWVNAQVYEIVGDVERQVLGGRETDLIWLNAEDRSAP